MTTSQDVRDSAAVTAFWRALDLPGLIDVHTHFMPDRVMRKVWAYFDAAGPMLGRPWPIKYRHDDDERVTCCAGSGFAAFSSLFYPHKPGMAAWLNDWAAGVRRRRRPTACTPRPSTPSPTPLAYVRAAIGAGRRVFKAHVQVGDYDPADPLLDDVWGALAEARDPDRDPLRFRPAPGRFTGPAPIAQRAAPASAAAADHRAHGRPGVVEPFSTSSSAIRASASTRPWCSPTSSNACLRVPARGDAARLRDLGDRILLGSDFPNIPYPYAARARGAARPRPRRRLAARGLLRERRAVVLRPDE